MKKTTFKGQQTTMGAGVFRSKDRGFKIDAVLHTAGNGFWSGKERAVKITGLALGYVDDECKFGELRVFFNRNTWRTDRDGLIYTDRLFERELQAYLATQGLAGKDVSYSEQGMQGDNYVSCDVGEKFLKSWAKVTGEDLNTVMAPVL